MWAMILTTIMIYTDFKQSFYRYTHFDSWGMTLVYNHELKKVLCTSERKWAMKLTIKVDFPGDAKLIGIIRI